MSNNMKSNITIQGLRKIGYKVMVIHDNTDTTIFVTNPQGKTSCGQSVCHSKDNFNRKLGNKIALGRAMKDMAEGIFTPFNITHTK